MTQVVRVLLSRNYYIYVHNMYCFPRTHVTALFSDVYAHFRDKLIIHTELSGVLLPAAPLVPGGKPPAAAVC